ncbi:hypothetical protein GE061_000045 [Apolygus lucorum]|uniref:PiggyBac transposable element-derived protein domain-containing protein n=1 Tax=Apolygus lucorum TaxID=248454 RepID=A0A6A4K2L7_APOLU|nr:hypothetical protein GE061_000045 [Apolygus lucorum]
MPFHGKKTNVIQSREHLLLTLVPKPGAESDDHLSDGEGDELDWDEERLEKEIQQLFNEIGFVDFDRDELDTAVDEKEQEATPRPSTSREKRKRTPPIKKKKKVISTPLIMKWEKSKFTGKVTVPPCLFESATEEEQSNRTPLSYFYHFFGDDCINLIVLETNRYSLQQTGTSLNVDIKTIKAFIDLHLLMGIIDLLALTDYWAKRFRQHKIADVMPLKKFLKLLPTMKSRMMTLFPKTCS